jgi:hypothetical protein
VCVLPAGSAGTDFRVCNRSGFVVLLLVIMTMTVLVAAAMQHR